MADEDPTPTSPEAEETRTGEGPASQAEEPPDDGPGVSGDTGGGTMPWGDNPGG